MEYNVKRAFEHKTNGSIGAVHLKAEVGKVTIGDKELPTRSVEYLLTFALQSLQDAYAGAKSNEQAVGLFDKKLDALIAGTIGVRTGGGTSELERVTLQVVRAILKAKLTEEAFAAYKEDDDKVLEAFEKNKAKLEPLVTERMEELAKERARKAKLAANAGELEL